MGVPLSSASNRFGQVDLLDVATLAVAGAGVFNEDIAPERTLSAYSYVADMVLG